ncbi:MAG: DNA polymerase III subunit gamma and tau [Nocardioidaceae bacterium]|nr:DNA polymerase III subunit gamma and tau [Nocardioidaceae bacterium]
MVVGVDAPLALYRRYRPDTFADVIGQDHVTHPLSHALDNNRVNHAYLFSGPRGCGKTTSARILARALNCEQGATSVPCGVCESCVELARGGPGSIDVIEIDAASHGGVDDARDLRERAFFSPMRSRYKVYIIDEAHMVSTQGFNALLKLVEEPPAHIRFVFATTEPDKVIGTIRSRTHHYPFRLVPPKILGDYIVELCQREGVTIEHNVVPLVVRAGAGSVRDSLSVLDQMIGGSGPDGVTYALATALLGYTPDSLLDETVDALAAADGGTVFGVVDKVIETGQDPRRFAEDLLHRLRDLVVVSAVPDALTRGLIEMPEDQAERLAGQAARLGRAELTRAADIVSTSLTDMRGATAPRLLLELMCARILLPGLDDSAAGVGARLDRVERRLSVVGTPSTELRQSAAAPSAPAAKAVEPPTDAPTPSVGDAAQVSAPSGEEASPASAEPSSTPTESLTPASVEPGGLTVVDVRRLWPGVLARVQTMKRYAWALLTQNAQVMDVGGGVITIGLVNAGARDSFVRGGHDEILRQALIDELGVDWSVEAIIDGTVGGPGRTARHLEPEQLGPPAASVAEPVAPAETPARTEEVERAKGAIRPTRKGDPAEALSDEPPPELHDDDDIIDESLTSRELLARELGAEVIQDIRHGSA